MTGCDVLCGSGCIICCCAVVGVSDVGCRWWRIVMIVQSVVGNVRWGHGGVDSRLVVVLWLV